MINNLRRMLPYMGDALPKLIVGIFVAILSSAVALTIPYVLRALVDGPLSTGDARQIWPAAGLLLGLSIAEAALLFLRRFFMLQPGSVLDGSMRISMYSRLQRLPISFHDRWQSGQLLSRAMGDVSTMRRWLSFGFVAIIVSAFTLVMGLGVLIWMNALLGIVFAIFIFPLVYISIRFRFQFNKVSRQAQDQAGELTTSVEESVHGVRVIKSFGRSDFFLAKFNSRANQLRETELTKGRTQGRLAFWLVFIPDTALAATLLLGILLAANGVVTVGTMFAFFATSAVLRWPLENIGMLLALTIDASNALDRYYEVIDSPVDIHDAPDAQPLEPGPGALVFEDVHFRFADAPADEADILNGISLNISPGETVALIGLTGSGKSTVTSLVSRLNDVTSGRILIDGQDIRDVTLDSLRTEVAMAFEDPTLFSLSVRENVLLGREDLLDQGPEAGAADLEKSLDIAQANFVNELPRGVETRIGEEGLSLSGGQRQRLALARAIATEPRMLILDDPLSALDVNTEAMVEAALRSVLSHTTALIVAHRPSTVMLADRVALLDQGVISEIGTHKELLARSARYRHVISALEAESTLLDTPTEDSPEVRS
jgi:ATP-binding cassette subfamily B protein